MTILEMQQKRAKLITEARTLQNRGNLSAEEGAKVDQMLDEADELKKKIERESKIAAHQRQLDESERRTVPPCGTSTAGDDTRFVGADGREVRVIKPADSMRAVMRETFPGNLSSDGLSWTRVVRGLVTGDWKGAEAELRAMSGGDAVGGGYLLPAPLAGEVIDLARAQSVLFQAGVHIVEMESAELTLAKLTKDVVPTWRHENIAATESNPEVGKLRLTARTLIGYASASVELVEDAPNVGEVVRDSLAKSLALELDRVGLRGIGAAAEPIGVLNFPDVQKIALAGTALTRYEDISKAVQKLLEKNGPTDGLSVIFAPRTWGELDRMKEATTNAPLKPPPSFERLKQLVTSQVPVNLGAGTNETEIYVGFFPAQILGLRLALTLQASREADDAFKNYQVKFRGVLRGDFTLAQAEHFCVITGITPQP